MSNAVSVERRVKGNINVFGDYAVGFQNPEGLPQKAQKMLTHTKFADQYTTAVVHNRYQRH